MVPVILQRNAWWFCFSVHDAIVVFKFEDEFQIQSLADRLKKNLG